ncbi:MAG: hypothetical protein WCV41_01680 [Patescibacteria group bacterium]
MYNQSEVNPIGGTESIEELVKQNLELTQDLQKQMEKIRRYFFWQRMVSIFYLIIVIGPIILGLIYLPPLLKDVIAPYQEALGGTSSANSLNVNSILNELKK